MTSDASKQGSLSGAAGAADDEQLAFGDFQVKGFDRGNHAVANDERLSKRRIEISAFMDPSGVALGLPQSPDWEKAKVKLNDCPFNFHSQGQGPNMNLAKSRSMT